VADLDDDGLEGVKPFVDALVGSRIGGRYVVERILGAGGMGVVAAANYPELEQAVAIKFLRPEHAANSILAARFLREAKLAARVKSPHFVRVFDLGTLDSGVPYLVMEMLSGRDLGAELETRGQFPIDEAVDYVLQAAVGVAEIHALGVVHRDLKPSNLFIASAAGSELLKVLDFGVSKESATKDDGKPLTSTESLVGTPQYMSPEQIRASKGVDVRSDLWSLGVILYQLVTGSLPFVSESGAVGELFGMILFTEPASPKTLRQNLPAGLEDIIMKCLQREANARYATVLELAEALQPFAASNSWHRVDAVKKALGNPHPVHVSEPAMARAALARTEEAPSNAVRRAAVTSMEPAAPAPITAMTSTLSTPASTGAFTKPRAIAGVVGTVVLLALSAWLLIGRRGAEQASAAPPPSASVEVKPQPEATVTAETKPAAPKESASAPTPVVSASAAEVSPHKVRRAAPRPSAAGAASAPPAQAGDLLLDRK
jgi:serine/threonine protein kinase